MVRVFVKNLYCYTCAEVRVIGGIFVKCLLTCNKINTFIEYHSHSLVVSPYASK